LPMRREIRSSIMEAQPSIRMAGAALPAAFLGVEA
jgi:hypothetical protein